MARKRMIDPDFWLHEGLGKISRDARLLFIAMWNFADDEGRLIMSTSRLKAEAFPYDDDVSLDDIKHWVAQIESVSCIQLYSVDGRDYIFIPGFSKHQTISHASKSKLPEPPKKVKTPEDSSSPPVVLQNIPEDSSSTPAKLNKLNQSKLIKSMNVIDETESGNTSAAEPSKKDIHSLMVEFSLLLTAKGKRGTTQDDCRLQGLMKRYGYDTVFNAIQDSISSKTKITDDAIDYIRSVCLNPKQPQQEKQPLQERVIERNDPNPFNLPDNEGILFWAYPHRDKDEDGVLVRMTESQKDHYARMTRTRLKKHKAELVQVAV